MAGKTEKKPVVHGIFIEKERLNYSTTLQQLLEIKTNPFEGKYWTKEQVTSQANQYAKMLLDAKKTSTRETEKTLKKLKKEGREADLSRLKSKLETHVYMPMQRWQIEEIQEFIENHYAGAA